MATGSARRHTRLTVTPRREHAPGSGGSDVCARTWRCWLCRRLSRRHVVRGGHTTRSSGLSSNILSWPTRYLLPQDNSTSDQLPFTAERGQGANPPSARAGQPQQQSLTERRPRAHRTCSQDVFHSSAIWDSAHPKSFFQLHTHDGTQHCFLIK